MKHILKLYDNRHDLSSDIWEVLRAYPEATYYRNTNKVVVGNITILFVIYNQRNVSKYHGYRFDSIWLHEHVFLLPEDRWFLMSRFTEAGKVIEGDITL